MLIFDLEVIRSRMSFYSNTNEVPKFKTIKSCPEFKEIVDIYSNKKIYKDISIS